MVSISPNEDMLSANWVISEKSSKKLSGDDIYDSACADWKESDNLVRIFHKHMLEIVRKWN